MRRMRRKNVCRQRTTLSVQCFSDTFIDFFVEVQIQSIFCISGCTKETLFHMISFLCCRKYEVKTCNKSEMFI